MEEAVVERARDGHGQRLGGGEEQLPSAGAPLVRLQLRQQRLHAPAHRRRHVGQSLVQSQRRWLYIGSAVGGRRCTGSGVRDLECLACAVARSRCAALATRVAALLRHLLRRASSLEGGASISGRGDGCIDGHISDRISSRSDGRIGGRIGGRSALPCAGCVAGRIGVRCLRFAARVAAGADSFDILDIRRRCSGCRTDVAHQRPIIARCRHRIHFCIHSPHVRIGRGWLLGTVSTTTTATTGVCLVLRVDFAHQRSGCLRTSVRISIHHAKVCAACHRLLLSAVGAFSCATLRIHLHGYVLDVGRCRSLTHQRARRESNVRAAAGEGK